MPIDEKELISIGALLLKLQGLESILKIYVSLLNEEAKQRNPRVKNLEVKNILDDSINGRHQTLGILIRAIQNEINFFDNEEFNKLLQMRNTFVHSFHKKYILENTLGSSDFLLELHQLVEKYTKVFNGALTSALQNLASRKGEQLDVDGLIGDEIEFFHYIKK